MVVLVVVMFPFPLRETPLPASRPSYSFTKAFLVKSFGWGSWGVLEGLEEVEGCWGS